MNSPDNFAQFERREKLPLKVQTLDSTTVMITEHNAQKRGNKEFFGDTFGSVRNAIETGKANEIPPIVVLQSPFISVEEARKMYQKFR